MTQSSDKPKALNSTDKRALGKLVDNDFAALRIEVKQFADEVLEERLASVRRTNAAAIRRAKAAETAASSALAAFVKATKDRDGVTVTYDDYHLRAVRNSIKATAAAVEQSEAEVRRETQRDLDKALAALERQRLTAQRQVLTAGISDEAKTLLAAIPSAAELMRSAGVQAKVIAR